MSDSNFSISRALQLSLWLLGALSCYIAGFENGTFFFVALGAVMEITFWLKLFNVERNGSNH